MVTERSLSLLFFRTTELAIARGEVPEDGSGLDGVWTAEFPDVDGDENWFVAVNTEDEPYEYRVTEDRTLEIPPYTGHYWYDTGLVVPSAIVNPHGGEAAYHGDQFERETEDQIIASLEAALDELGYDYGGEQR